MRMRMKKNLPSRLDEVDDYIVIKRVPSFYAQSEEERFNLLNYKELFGNDNPVHLEIGCGKGKFAVESASLNPNVNFLAVEKIANVLVPGAEEAKKRNLPNLRFLNCGAENLNYFLPPDSISRIYLNFSCPYPKKQYENNRLTYKNFLQKYVVFMKKDAEIHLKTDNKGFFEYSISSLSDFGFTIKNVSLDLHASDFTGNVVTEYEEKFSAEGVPILRLEAYLKN